MDDGDGDDDGDDGDVLGELFKEQDKYNTDLSFSEGTRFLCFERKPKRKTVASFWGGSPIP